MKKILIIPLLVLAFGCNPKQTADMENNTTDSVNVVVAADTIAEQPEVADEDLSSYFDEVRNGSQTIVQPEGISDKSNTIYCYFRLKSKKASNFRMRIQYWDANFSEADQYTFNVDGKRYTYIANRNRNTLGDSRIVEGSTFYWYDDGINKKDESFLKALGKSKQATVHLIDRATNETVASIPVTAQVKKTILRTLEYYYALDGSLIPREGMVNIRDY